MVSMHHAKRQRQPTESEHEGIQVVRYDHPILPAWHPGRVKHTINAAADIVRTRLAEQAWDVVHFHSLLTGNGVLTALGQDPHYVFTVHSPSLLEQEINWARQGLVGRLKLLFGKGALLRLERRLLEASTEIHTLSEFTRRQLEKLHGVGDRVTVVPHWRRPETAT